MPERMRMGIGEDSWTEQASGFWDAVENESIGIVFRQLKSVFDKPDGNWFRGHDFNDVKAKNNVGHIKHSEPGHRPPDDQALLLRVDRLEGTTELLRGPGLYFDEDQLVASLVPSDDINFPSVRRPEISKEDLVSVVSQMPGREFFAVAAQLQVGSFRLQKQHGTDSFGQARCFRPHGVPSSAATVERGLRCPTASTRSRRISAIPSGFSLAP